MARFRATIQGQRGEASRLGNGKTGIQGRVNGWHVGVRVSGYTRDGEDVFAIYATGGSSPRHSDQCIGYVRLRDGIPRFTTDNGA
jgi:hypothetical protein